MVAETQRVRVRLLWDDQGMRQTMAAAAGFDRLGKSVAAAAGFDRLGKSVVAAHTVQLRALFDTKKLVGPMFGGELQRIAQGLAEAHRVSLRPAFDASKMFRVGIGGELQRASQAMAEAHRVRPALDASKVLRVGMGGEKMQQVMAAAAGLDKVTKIMADSYRVRTPPLFDTKKLVGPMLGGEVQRMAQAITGTYRMPVRPLWDGEKMRQAMAAAAGLDKVAKVVADTQRRRMQPLFDTSKVVKVGFGGEFQRMAQAMAGAYRVPVRPRFDVQGVVEVAQGLVDAAIAVPSTPTTGSVTVVNGSFPAETPLFPGLMNPWEQVRCWDLQAWIAFLAFLVAAAGLLVAMGQSRAQGGLSPEELKTAIRIIQENQEQKTSTSVSNTTIPASRSKASPHRRPPGAAGQ
jgi:hypothetical protein